MKHLLLPLLLLITIITGCDDNKDNVENYSFPVLSHTAWDGQLETNVAEHGNADASIEFETSSTGSYSFTYDDGTNATGNFTYLVSGQIIIFQKTCKELEGSWTLVDTGNGYMALDKNISSDNLAEITTLTLKQNI